MANGLNTIKVALSGLSPFISGVSKEWNKRALKCLIGLKIQHKQFFEMMGTTGVRIFNNMLSAAGQFGSGIISVLTQLLAEWVSAGFKNGCCI